MKKPVGCVSLIALAGAAMAVPAQAQTADETVSGLGEIVVTAQRRSENLQRTPIAISAVTADVVEKLGISEVTDLANIAPNLNVLPGTSTSVGSVITLRGIATPTDEMMTLDTPIGLYIDGVYLARSGASVFDVGEIERIEVLRGPQGSLFGRNTTGGAVNFITRKPSEDFGLIAKAGIGRFGSWNSKLTLDTGRIADSARVTLSYAHRERHGLTDNVLARSRNDPGAQNIDSVRAAVTLDPSDAVTIDYVFDYSDRNAHPYALQMINATSMVRAYLDNSPALGGNAPLIQKERVKEIALDNDGGAHDRIWGHMVRLAADFDQITVKTTTAFRGWNSKSRADLDGQGGLRGLLFSGNPYDPNVGDVGLFHSSNNRRQRQFSQEFEIASAGDGPLQWVAGAFYFRETGRERAPQQAVAVVDVRTFLPEAQRALFPAALAYQGFVSPGLLEYRSKSRSEALFGQVSYRPQALDGRLGLTIGGRYNWDKKSVNQTAPFINNDSVSFSEPTGNATLDYRVTGDVNVYGRVARGYRSGGYSVRSSQSPFRPEKLWSYETGIKADLLDNRLRLNAAAFINSYTDQQVSQPVLNPNGTFGQIIVNAGKTSYQGVELEAVAIPAQGLTLTGSLGYIDIDIKRFDALGTDIAGSAKPQNAPSVTANASMEYAFDMGSLATLTLRGDWNYRSRMYFFATPVGMPFFDDIVSPGRSLVDAQIRLDDVAIGNGDWSLTAFVKNLTDKKHTTRAIDFGALGYAGVWYGDPRTWGLELSVRF